MNPIRPFKFEKAQACCSCATSAPVVATGDDQGLTIAQLAEKYGEGFYGPDASVAETLQGLVGNIASLEGVQTINVDDNVEMDLHAAHGCALLQGVEGKVVITDNTGREHKIVAGDSLLIPAATTLIEIDGAGQLLLAKF
ncbi:MAG: hypothetical protein Q4B68_08900 [Bacteroidales bacterium]|nr:hypothetical protein [Bacteroidales bacterium]